jgi:hypothetical protein
MKTRFISCWAALASTITLTANLVVAQPAAPSTPHHLRIGVYDSRAVAVAYANSSEFRETLKLVQADYQQAKEANDEKAMAKIKAKMQLSQRRKHEQGFSTGSIIEITATIKSALPAVAKEADVDLIVSKWEVTYQSDTVETIDVTDRLVALFHTDARGAKWAKQIQEKPPIPMEKITDDLD